MFRRITLCLLLALSFVACVRTPQKGGEGFVVDVPEWYKGDTLRAAYIYTEGVKRLALADDELEVVPYFKKVLEIDSLHAPSHHRLADIYYAYNVELARPHSEIAYRSDSTNLDYASLYGYILASQGELAKARSVYERIIAEKPAAESYRFLAMLYMRSEMPHMALTVLDSAEYKLGRIEVLTKYKRDLLIRMGLYDRAISEAISAIEANPRDMDSRMVLAILYDKTAKPDLAEEEFKKAVEISPNDVGALYYLGDFYKNQGREEEFLGIIKTLFLGDELPMDQKVEIYDSQIVEDEGLYRRNYFTVNSLISILNVKYPHDYEVGSRYATHLIRGGELERALEIYKEFVADATKPKDAIHTVIEIEEYLGHRDSVMHYIDLGIERFPTDEDFYYRKGYELLKEGRTSEAKEVFLKVVKIAENDEVRSLAYTTLGDNELNPKKSAKYYRKALKYNPENAQALNNWAYFSCEGGGDLEEALELSVAACELEPQNATYLDTKAWILFKLGRLSEAKSIMRQAISLDRSGDSTLLLHYGDILAAEGEVFMAELYYKRALDAGEEPAVIEERIKSIKK